MMKQSHLKIWVFLMATGAVVTLSAAADCPVQVTPGNGCPYYENECPLWIDTDTMYIYPSGSSTNRIDVMFTGDGFPGDFLTTTFFAAVSDAIEAILSMEPFKSHTCAFNFFASHVISAESGADYQYVKSDGSGDIVEECVNNQLNTSFGHRKDISDPSDDIPEYMIWTPTQTRCFNAAKISGMPDFDILIVLVNDTKYGGAAYHDGETPLMFVSMGENFETTITHELAHVIAPLEDEYNCGVCDCDGQPTVSGTTLEPWPTSEPEPEELNVTTDLNSDKWEVSSSITVPTDPATALPHTVGRFEGAASYNEGIYRPQLRCHMRCLFDDDGDVVPFCQVCTSVLADEMPCPPALPLPEEVVGDRMAKSFSDFWTEAKLLKFPCPMGSYSYDTMADTVQINLRASSPVAQAVIVGENGNRVAQGRMAGGVLTTVFLPAPFEQYWLVIDTGPPSADVLTVHADMTVNSAPFILPD